MGKSGTDSAGSIPKKAEDNFEAKAEILDFSDKENTCNTINAWCNENTEGLIPEIMKPDMLNENSELCLTNSLYFESGWSQDPWDVSDEKEKFGDNEETKYMTSIGDNYYEMTRQQHLKNTMQII